MGFARRIVRKSVRKATPRSVRRAMHPVGTLKSAVTPRPIKQLSRGLYTVSNPLGAAENALIGAVLYPGGRRRRSSSGRSRPSVGSVAWSGPVSPVGMRAQEAADVNDELMALFAAERERFAPSARLLVPRPQPINPAPHALKEWKRRKREVRPWQRTARKELRAAVDQQVQAWAHQQHQMACANADQAQANADAWWTALVAGDSGTLTKALTAAFADNPAPAAALHADGPDAVVALLLPVIDVLPPKKAHITPTGKLSSKAWTKTERNDVYVELLGAHLLATLREAFAVGPSLRSCRVIGVRPAGAGEREFLFDVKAGRDNAEAMTPDRTATRRVARGALGGRGPRTSGHRRSARRLPR